QRELREIGVEPKISGESAFKLHATYGFPIDLTEQMANENGLSVDMQKFQLLMDRAREEARAAAKSKQVRIRVSAFGADAVPGPTNDTPKYEGLQGVGTVVCWTIDDAVKRDPPLRSGDVAGLVLDTTCFYSEQGGQVGDAGVIETDTGVFDVQTTQAEGGIVVHSGVVRTGEIREGQTARCRVDATRQDTMKNHTATHMLNWALREVLCSPEERKSPHVQQKGSLVDPEKTRFDFSHSKPVSYDELARVEKLVNERIDARQEVYTQEVEERKARKINTLRAVFGEKYPEIVRVVSIGAGIDEMLADPNNERWLQYPVELCGGTHLKNTGEAERFVLTTEEGVAKGIRRVVGITGESARRAIETGRALLAEVDALTSEHSAPPLTSTVKSQPARPAESLSAALTELQRRVNESVISIALRHELQERIAELQNIAKRQDKQAASDARGAVIDRVAALLTEAQTIAGVTIVVGDVPPAPPDALRSAVDWVRNKTKASAVLIATVADERVTLIAGMSKEAVNRGIKAGDLIKQVSPLVGGKGGGRSDMAQGGGGKPAGVPQAVEAAREWLFSRLS
ncbi:MAG: alanine--tRNA ligase-related protein, partial [Phycisphaerae bacterium]